MITNLHIENFKSIENMDLPLGNLNILIGENGCGKTNILEAAAIGVAAAKDKLDNEYYFARGIRKTENRFMKSAFAEQKAKEDIIINFILESGESIDFRINENVKGQLEEVDIIRLKGFTASKSSGQVISANPHRQAISNLNFLLYAPENTFLRKFEEEGQIEGLGVRGEGLFDYQRNLFLLSERHNPKTFIAQAKRIAKKYKAKMLEQDKLNAQNDKLKTDANLFKEQRQNKEIEFLEALKQIGYGVSQTNEIFQASMEIALQVRDLLVERETLNNQKAAFEQLPKIQAHLRELLDWFEYFEITGSNMERKLYIKDRFLPEATLFDQKSANEGFLLLLFYLTLFTGAETPTFFAIDNIDTGLNPKLGSRLIEILAQLAKEHNKQAIITTHNPAILDGLDLRDDAQRLFVVSRNRVGKTKIEQVENQQIMENGTPLKLSEKFMRGYIGGLPKNF